MTTPSQYSCSIPEGFNRVISELTQPQSPLPTELKQALNQSIQEAGELGERLTYAAHTSLEGVTQTIGNTLQPIAANPAVDAVARLPWLNWLLLWMGQVDRAQAQADVDALRQQYPADTSRAIAQRIIDDTALQAGRIGFLTNIIPPVALALFAVDIAAVMKLQAEMVYRVAAAYDFDLSEPVRRGEVIAMYGLSFGTGTPIKAGLSVVELVPVIGAFVGASSNAILLYLLGGAAQHFYKMKRDRRSTPISIEG
ncbi:MAG: hypothetical protein WBA57_09855 [Elainellaceae cyanobacterium]